MRKLIETVQETGVCCDNPNCDFVLENKGQNSLEPIESFLNVPCPKCGENLLTEEDLLNHIELIKMVNWINKWFSWITIFYFKRKKSNYVTAEAYTHKGITIKIKKP